MENLTKNLFEKWRKIDVQFQLFYYKYIDFSKKPLPGYLQPVLIIRWSSGTWKLASGFSLVDILLFSQT